MHRGTCRRKEPTPEERAKGITAVWEMRCCNRVIGYATSFEFGIWHVTRHVQRQRREEETNRLKMAKAYSVEERRSLDILQRNRHSSVSPYAWYGPAPEPPETLESCPCSGCNARRNIRKDLAKVTGIE